MNEQDILHALRTLPIAVCITPRPNEGTYLWQCLQGNGSTPTLAAALSEALTYLTHTLAGDATVIEDLLRSQN